MKHYNKLITTSIIFTGAFIVLLFLSAYQAVATNNNTIRQTIRNKVAKHANLSSAKVSIHVEDGFVLFTGSVNFYLQKMDFEQIAWKTTGVTDVENEIKVKPESPLSDAAIEKKVQAILMDVKRFHEATYDVQVGKGIVSVTGIFYHPRDVRFLKRQIAEIE
ncbi:MAG TPA: BON domain-containing protein, partial [Desulfobulbaceae bacterium]|nr:BON domain-containing protein [Desulfobulbaceae bacterium]